MGLFQRSHCATGRAGFTQAHALAIDDSRRIIDESRSEARPRGGSAAKPSRALRLFLLPRRRAGASCVRWVAILSWARLGL